MKTDNWFKKFVKDYKLYNLFIFTGSMILFDGVFQSWTYALSLRNLVGDYVALSIFAGIIFGLKSYWFESYTGPKIETTKEEIKHRICCDDCEDDESKILHEQAMKEIDEYLAGTSK